MSLAASVHDILGESYVAGFQTIPLQGAHNHQIQLSSKGILGLEVLLGRYGVVGARVHYQDGSVSPWLGQSVSKWRYFIRGNDLRRLHVQSDESKYILWLFRQTPSPSPRSPFSGISTSTFIPNPDAHSSMPVFIVRTTIGRCLYYGPYILPKIALTQAHFSTLGYETSHHVSGIFFDAMISSPGWAKTIGVTLEPNP
ncbi:hypothetical protein V2G26_013274 [Clonostachys chloroleuca]